MIARPAASLTLLLAAAVAASAQSSTHTSTHRASTTHRSSTSAAQTALNPADNPPGVPPVHTPPKTLYALRYVDVVVGTGPLAPPQNFYTVKYTGWLTDGTKFDSSYDHPGQAPITFFAGAHRVIPGWDTGFTGMRVGGKRRLYIPYQLAYGEAGREGAIPPKADLIFDIELVSFSSTPTPPASLPRPNPSVPNPDEPQPQSSSPDAPTAH